MPDIAAISAAITSVRTAIDLAKLVRESSTSLAEAELKLKLADLIGELSEAKNMMTDVREELHKKEEIISASPWPR